MLVCSYDNHVHYQIQIVISLCISVIIYCNKNEKNLMILKILFSLGTDWWYPQCLAGVHSEIYEKLSLREKMEKMIITVQNMFKWHEQQRDAYWEKSWYVTAVHSTCSFCGLKQNVSLLACMQVDYSRVFIQTLSFRKNYRNYFDLENFNSKKYVYFGRVILWL